MTWWKYTSGRFNGNNFTQKWYGTSGNDSTVYNGSDGLYIAGPFPGNDYLQGNRGSDTLYGYMGNDILVGVNPDYYNAGSGEKDRLNGGSGNDIFVLGDSYETYYQDYGYAIIEDFRQGYDKLAVNGSASDYRYRTGNVSGVGTNTQDTILTTADGDWVAVFQDTTFSPLYASDFIGLG